MKKEIRQEIREYILSDVNLTLARLGVSEPVKETSVWEGRHKDKLEYMFKSAPFHQMPMMFKKAFVKGYITAVDITDEESRFYEISKDSDVVVVCLEYEWESFRRGSNGTEIGRVIYAVEKNLPETFKQYDSCDYYVRKLEGLEL